MDPLDELKKMAEDKGGSMTMHEIKNEQGEVVHSFATMSMLLRKDHWIYQKGEDGYGMPSPMPLRMGGRDVITLNTSRPVDENRTDAEVKYVITKREMAEMIRAAGKYAVRASTMHGSEMDFDPDAMLQNLCVGFLGYWTANGFGGEPWEDPKEPWAPPAPPEPTATAGNVATGAAPQV